MKTISFFFCLLAISSSAYAGADEDLIKYIQNNDLDGVKSAIAAGANVDALDNFGNPALSVAVWWPDILKEIITAGADVNNEGKVSNAPLFAAASWGMTKSMQMLIEAGADVNFIYNGTKTKIPLIAYVAGNSNCAKCVQLLIEAGANVRAKDKYKMTAMGYAAGAKSVQYRLDNHQYTMNYLKNVAKLTNFPSHIENPTTENFDEPEAIMMILVNAGADPNEKDKIGNTPIIWAAEWNNLDMVTALIEAGADVNQDNKLDQTAIQYAANWGNVEMTKVLLEAGADPNVEFEDIDRKSQAPLCEGFTPLAKAVQHNHYDVAKLLIKYGAKVDASLKGMTYSQGTTCRIMVKGKTPLFFAVEHKNLDMVKLLVENGAKIYAKQKTSTPKDAKIITTVDGTYKTWCEGPFTQKTPIEVAEAFGYTDIVKYLKGQ